LAVAPDSGRSDRGLTGSLRTASRDKAHTGYGTYETQDGKCIAAGGIEPQFYASLPAVMELDAAEMPAQNDRSAWPAMRERFGAVFRTRGRDDWVCAAAGRDACVSPVLPIDDAPQHLQMRKRGAFTRFDDVLHRTPAPRFSRTPAMLRRPKPAPGQHADDVLRECGVESAAAAHR